MIAEIKVPEVGESITEGILIEWKKENGEYVNKDDDLFELETDKITLTVASEYSGKLTIGITAGTTVTIGQVLATIDTSAEAPVGIEKPEEITETVENSSGPLLSKPAGLPQMAGKMDEPVDLNSLSPAVRRLVAEHLLDPRLIQATGKDGRIIKQDVLSFIAELKAPIVAAKSLPQSIPEAKVEESAVPAFPKIEAKPPISEPVDTDLRQTRKPMSPLRARIAERMVLAQQSAAILTTFNEVDMSVVIDMRKRFQETFTARYGVKLGFMSFFVKAVVEALKAYPEVNVQIDGDEIVYNHFYDIGIAVSTKRGLVVPVLRDADKLDFGQIEQKIGDFAQRAHDRKLTLEELSGGVYSISNGGVFGSLLSTPILNPPQPAILGLHAIKKRPVVVGDDDRIEVRPMMYLAMSYDHRLIDGREAVTFLKHIVGCIEAPEKLTLGLCS